MSLTFSGEITVFVCMVSTGVGLLVSEAHAVAVYQCTTASALAVAVSAALVTCVCFPEGIFKTLVGAGQALGGPMLPVCPSCCRVACNECAVCTNALGSSKSR